MTDLKSWVVGALMIATISVGLTGFISDGLSKYNVQENASTDSLSKLEKVSNASSLADKAQQRAENVNAKSNFFTLPGLIKTLKLAFDSIGIWDVFISTAINLTGLNLAHGSWPAALATGTVVITIAFLFAKRVLG